ncbi:unnamed protein product [Clavelina lepadiformis]|uniref:Uncharacterized protein n=1 Tax=Clavelina lepadiformis TaxID=159417 RepID=A0ABP0FYV0_CLALP
MVSHRVIIIPGKTSNFYSDTFTSRLYEKCCRLAYTTQQYSSSELSSDQDEDEDLLSSYKT